jgi:hypothetical protein
MRQEWALEELVASWTLLDADWALGPPRAHTPLFWTHVNPHGKFTRFSSSEAF